MYTLQLRNISSNIRIIPFQLCLKGESIGRSTLIINPNNQLMIEWFQIEKQHQGLGHGQRFYFEIEHYIKNCLNYNTINLHTTKSAYLFWRRLGFQTHFNDQLNPIASDFEQIPELYSMIKMI